MEKKLRTLPFRGKVRNFTIFRGKMASPRTGKLSAQLTDEVSSSVWERTSSTASGPPSPCAGKAKTEARRQLTSGSPVPSVLKRRATSERVTRKLAADVPFAVK